MGQGVFDGKVVTVDTFHGGIERGRCVQISENAGRNNYVQIPVPEALAMCAAIRGAVDEPGSVMLADDAIVGVTIARLESAGGHGRLELHRSSGNRFSVDLTYTDHNIRLHFDRAALTTLAAELNKHLRMLP